MPSFTAALTGKVGHRIARQTINFQQGVTQLTTPFTRPYFASTNGQGVTAYNLAYITFPQLSDLSFRGLMYRFRSYFQAGNDAISAADAEYISTAMFVYNPTNNLYVSIAPETNTFGQYTVAATEKGIVPNAVNIEGAEPFFCDYQDNIEVLEILNSLTGVAPTVFPGYVDLYFTEFDVSAYSRTKILLTTQV